MLELTKRLLEAAEGGEPIVLASVLEAGPRSLAPGTRMLVSPSGERMGTLGDADLDAAVCAYAMGAFARHAAETVYVAETAPAGASEGAAQGLSLTPRVVADATSVYLEVVEHRPVFLVVGAGHVGRSVARVASFLGYHVAVLDDREDFADAEKLPGADEVICEDFETGLDRFPINGNTSIVLVTRGHKQDELSLRRCLGRGAGYLGMIGSKRRTRAVLEHLNDEGLDPEELAKVRTPIGLDIGAESPEEIAISVLAEVILLRKGGSGAPMYHRTGANRAD